MTEQNVQNAGAFDALIYILPKYYDKVIPKGADITVLDVLAQIEGDLVEGDKELYNIVKNNASEIGNYKVSCPGWMDDAIPGTAACTFSDDSGHYYIAFQGTGDGEWPDNSVAFNGADSLQQKRAAQYYEKVIAYHHISEEDQLIVTGHSKGGNKAQYITLTSNNRNLIDECYSFDGQGFSKEAMDKMEQNGDFSEQQEKLFGIDGENDYVHFLGNEMAIPDDHRIVVPTPHAKAFENFHELQFLFRGKEDGYEGMLWKLNDVYPSGESTNTSFADLSKRISQKVSELPKDQQEGCARSIMQLIEMTNGRMLALNGDNATAEDYGILFKYGLPIIIDIIRDNDIDIGELMGKSSGDIDLHSFLEGYWGKTVEQFIEYVDPETAGLAAKCIIDYFADKGGFTGFNMKEFWDQATTEEKMAIVSILNSGVVAAGKEKLKEATVGDVLLAIGMSVAALTNPISQAIVTIMAEAIITFEIIVWTWDHRHEIERFIDGLTGKVNEFCESVKDTIVSRINSRIELVAELCQGISTGVGVVINFHDAMSENARLFTWNTIGVVATSKVGDLIAGHFAPYLYFYVKAVGYNNPVNVKYDLVKLEDLASRLRKVATDISGIDSSLSSLYSKLLIKDIDQGKNIVTCLADLFHLVRADIVVDSGWMVRGESQRLDYAVQELRNMKNELR